MTAPDLFDKNVKSKLNILFTNEVGSRMWGMEDLASDYDWVNIYQNRSYDILRGNDIHANYPQKQYIDGEGRNMDETFMEIGHLINLICKGNINAIWAATSPLTIKHTSKDHPCGSPRNVLTELIVEEGLSKLSWHSIYGMGMSQLRDAEKRAEVRDSNKSLRTAARTFMFGTVIFNDGLLCYDIANIIPQKIDIQYVYDCAEHLKKAFDNTSLPETPNTDWFKDYLYELRINDLGLIDPSIF